MFQPLDTFPFPSLRSIIRAAWWITLDKTVYALRYRLERSGLYIVHNYWVWPQMNFRLNSSLMWGASPYKEWAVGPFRYRRYQYLRSDRI